MQTEVIEVQGPVARPESVRQKIGSAAWGHGASTFIANGVPFSFTTGPALAERVCACAAFLAEEREVVRVHDVGAGTGYLTRHLAEAISGRSDRLAEQCHFVASDASSGMVLTMQDVLADVPPAKIEVRVADAMSVDDLIEEDPAVVVMSYLVDAIPPRHVVDTGDGLHDLLIQTYVVADEPVVDASTWPPRVLSGEALAEVLRREPESLSPGAALQVLPLLLEAAVEGPLVAPAGGAELSNARPEFVSVISQLVTRLNDESVILVTDFGYANGSGPEEVEPLMTEYGSATCFAVFFDELVRAAEEAGATCRLDGQGPGKTHTLLIYKGNREESFNSVAAQVLSSQDVSSIGAHASDDELTAADLRALASVEEGLPISYASLANLAHLFASKGVSKRARFYADLCDKRFGLIAAPEQLLLGDLSAEGGHADVAFEYYERARHTAPTYGATHLKAAGLLLEKGAVVEYADVMRAYLRVTDEPMPEHTTWLVEEGATISAAVVDEYRQLCRSEFEEKG